MAKSRSTKEKTKALATKPVSKPLLAEDDESLEDREEDLSNDSSMPVVYDPYGLAKESVAELPDEPVDETGITSSDPLKRYLQEIKRTPTLTPEQEQALVKRMIEAGDVQAAKLLVSANLKLVVRIAYEYRSMYHNLLDLIQEGNVGLMKAVSKFDPTKGARLGYYATWWIRSYILKYLLDNFRLVRVGTSQAQKKLFYHLMREKQRLEAQGITAAPALLAQNLNVKEKDVVEMQMRLLSPGAETSLDAPSHSEDPKSSLINFLLDPKESADVSLERDEWLQILARELPAFRSTLNDKEQMVLDHRILAEEPKTLQEVADEFGLTRERVRQIEARIIEKLRTQLTPVLK